MSELSSFSIFLLHFKQAMYVDIEVTAATDPSTAMIESSVNLRAKAKISVCGFVCLMAVPLLAELMKSCLVWRISKLPSELPCHEFPETVKNSQEQLHYSHCRFPNRTAAEGVYQ